MEECEKVRKNIKKKPGSQHVERPGGQRGCGLEPVSFHRGGREESGFSGGDGAGESLSRARNLDFLP